jgi:hypothetical protein
MSENIDIQCSSCGTVLSAPLEYKGREAKCRKCHTAFTIDPKASVSATQDLIVAEAQERGRLQEPNLATDMGAFGVMTFIGIGVLYALYASGSQEVMWILIIFSLVAWSFFAAGTCYIADSRGVRGSMKFLVFITAIFTGPLGMILACIVPVDAEVPTRGEGSGDDQD